MSGRSFMPSEIEILLADGQTWQPLSLIDEIDQAGGKRARKSQFGLDALLADVPLGEKLAPRRQKSWVRGIGLDYNWAPGVYCRSGFYDVDRGESDGYALPAGAVTSQGVQSRAVGEGVAFAEYGGHLWIATNLTTGTGKVNQNASGTATGASAFATSLTLGASEFVRDLLVADDGAGTAVLFATSSESDGSNARMHKWDGALWVSTPLSGAGSFDAAGFGLGRMAKVYWRTSNNAGAWRIVTISSRNTISYTLPGGDPTDPADWVPDAFEIDTAHSLLELVGFKEHVYVTAKDNVYDMTADGSTPGLTSYLPKMMLDGTGVAAEAHDGYVYLSVGQGIERVRVEDAPVLQVNPGQCAPGWGTRAENEARGYCTAMAVDQGWLVAAIYNPSTTRTYVCWGKDRTILGIDSPNPLIWHGPELVLAADYKITRMWTTGLGGGLRLWCSATSVAGNGLLVFWLSLPLSGTPLQDLISGGPHRFCTGTAVSTFLQPYSYLELLPLTWDDPLSVIVYRHAFGSKGLSSTTKLTLQVAADPAPGAITYPSGTDVTTSPIQNVLPTAVSGSVIWRKITFTSPSGGATPPLVPILDAIRTDAWMIAPVATTLPLAVRYGGGVLGLDNQESDRDPDWVTDQLVTLTVSAPTTIRTKDNRRFTVKIASVLDAEAEWNDGVKYGKTVTARCRATVLAGPL